MLGTGIRLFFTFAIVISAFLAPGKVQASVNAVSIPSQPVPYAPDFATNEFHDAWDMSEFSDVSQYLNGSGRHVHLANPTVQNGLFTATSLGDYLAKLSYLYLLFPDYPLTVKTGKTGSTHPIKSSQYKCFYVAMQANSPAYQPGSGITADGIRVMWYKNDNMSPAGLAPNGGTVQIFSQMESSGDPYPARPWKLFKVDLTNPPNGIYQGGVPWTGAAEWQGLEFTPTLFKNVAFQIDWVKLTNNCSAEAAYQAPISFSANSNINSIWLNPSGTSRNIRIAADVIGSSGQYTLDTKGLAAGKYRVGFGDLTSCCSQWSTTELEINTPAHLDILRPSTTSGVEFSQASGNPWDIYPSDVTSLQCADYSYTNDILNITTQYPALLPYACRGSNPLYEADPKIYLNTPASIAPNSGYRYLNFRMYQNGPWQMAADGMMARWMWTTQNGCTFVSTDIPLDVGWNTYAIDLYDPLNGTPVTVTAPCTQYTPWVNAATIQSLRFDPNENYTGQFLGDAGQTAVPAMVFDQKIDWIKLTKMDQVKAGIAFPIEYKSDKVLPQSAFTFYYTSTLLSPRQHIALAWTAQILSSQTVKIFLPILTTPLSLGSSDVSRFQWDTRGIAPGQYSICVDVNDGKNIATTCSSAPVEITN
jgi:hypothetical protein